ncbi:poly [ADP-ribose] polymerase tankyrase-like [Uloborus diversus]|uniref:poly [ADP-ribose] polymerase tankyrase-like n=1 Tax=Uloborus diversus TaxID=327109 RepID=UPI002409BD02|nr:poly [ADP-ribose] polymerase tankyrase-like [Uloborus diversus]
MSRAASEASQDKKGRTELHLAAETRDLEKVRKLLGEGLDTRAQDRDGRTPLHIALLWGMEATANLLMDADNVNDIPDGSGLTPLHLAVWQRYLGMVEKLLAAGANPRLQDKWGWTPLHRAVFWEQEKLVEHLLDADSELDIVNEDGHTPLHFAAMKGSARIVRKLLLSKMRPQVKNNRGMYPLEEAFHGGHDNIVKEILVSCAWRDITINWTEIKIREDRKQFCTDVLTECHAEIQKMKDTRILKSRVSFYNLVMRHACWIVPYLTDEIVRYDLYHDSVTDFPYYAHLIDPKMRRVQERKVLEAKCLECFILLTRQLPPLPETCLDMVLLCLSDTDMQNFIAAMKS